MPRNIQIYSSRLCPSESGHGFDSYSQLEARIISIKNFFQQQQTEVQDGEIRVMKMAKFSFKMLWMKLAQWSPGLPN